MTSQNAQEAVAVPSNAVTDNAITVIENTVTVPDNTITMTDNPTTVTEVDHDGGIGKAGVRRALVPVDSIIVEETYGREFDDEYIATLAAFLERNWLWVRITVSPDLTLLSGHRWLAAVQRLGHRMVEVVIVEVTP